MVASAERRELVDLTEEQAMALVGCVMMTLQVHDNMLPASLGTHVVQALEALKDAFDLPLQVTAMRRSDDL